MEWEGHYLYQHFCSSLLCCQVHEQKENPSYREMLKMTLRLEETRAPVFHSLGQRERN